MDNRLLRKALLLFVALCAIGQSSFAAQNVFDHPLSNQTQSRYTALCAQIASHPYVKGSFEQIKTVRRPSRSLKSAGNFIIYAGTGMVWDTLTPFPSTLAMGRDFIIQSAPGKPKSKIDTSGNPMFSSMAETIGAIFTGQESELRQKFDNYFEETQTAGNAVWSIGLIPKEKAMRSVIDRIVLEGSGGSGLDSAAIRSLTMYERSGNSTAYILSNHSYPAELSADEKKLFSAD